MTDNEIIKALEVCGNPDIDCSECPMKKNYPFCNKSLYGIALDLINRQQAEIAELQSELIITKNNFDNAKERCDVAVKIGQNMNEKLIDAYKMLQTAKSEAIKEFAERLKDKVDNPVLIEGKYIDRVIDIIDNLVKEITEQRKEDEGK